MRLLFALAFFILLTSQAEGQKNIDSLRRVLTISPKDTNYAKVLFRLVKLYNNTNQDSSIYFGNQILSLPANAIIKGMQVQVYVYMAYAYYMKGEYKNSIRTYQNMQMAAAKDGDKTNMAIAISNEGNVYIETGDYDAAISQYKQAMAIHESINDSLGVARCYNNIGYVNKELGNFDKAIDNYLIALKLYETKNLKNDAAMVYINVATIYSKQNNFEKALEYNNKALTITTAAKFDAGRAICLNAIANIYAQRKEYKKALENYNAANKVYQAQHDVRQMAIMNSNLGKMYNLEQLYDSSAFYYAQAVELNKKIGNNRNLASALLGGASALIALNKLDEAAKNLDTAESIIKTTNKKEDLQTFYLVKSDYLVSKGNEKSALNFYKKYTELKDTLFNEENTKTIADLNIKYETEKKKLQIDLLNKDNSIKENQIKLQKLALTKRAFELTKKQLELSQASLTISNNELEIKTQKELLLQKKIDSALAVQKVENLKRQTQIKDLEIEKEKLLNNRKNILIGVILLLSLLIGLLAYSYYRRHKLKEEAKLQLFITKQQELATKAILTAEENERKRIAGDLHDGLGQMIVAAKMNLSVMEDEIPFTSEEQKFTFEKVINLIDNSLKEVRTVSHTMMPNALLKAGLASAISEFIKQIDKRIIKIQLHTEGLNERIDQNTESILYRVVQECVNNVIKHSGATQLDISLIKSADKIEATIEDNGKGFDIKTAVLGIGLNNIKTRIKYLKGEIEWSSEIGHGTIVSFHVPV